MKRKNGMFTLAKDRPLMHVKWNQVIWTFVKKNRIHSTKKFLFWNYILCFENEVKVFSISFFSARTSVHWGGLVAETLVQDGLSALYQRRRYASGGDPGREGPEVLRPLLRAGQETERPDEWRHFNPRPRQLPHHRRQALRPRQRRPPQTRRGWCQCQRNSPQWIRSLHSLGKVFKNIKHNTVCAKDSGIHCQK